MDVKFKKTPYSLTISFYGELDEYGASLIKESVDKLLEESLTVNKIVFNLSGLSFMDSTGVGFLIGRYKKLKNYGIETYITGANLSIEKVIELSGLYKIMPKA